jgi:predicted O-methyltransferase YrrM
MNIIKALTPYGIVKNQSKLKLKYLLKNILPNGLVEYLIKKNNHKIYTVEYLKSKYVSDLTDNEKWAILAILLFLEKKQKQVEYLEIGIYAGGTIRFLKDNSTHANFTGVDLFEDFKPSEDNTHMWKNYTREQVLKALGKDRVSLIKGFSVDCLQKLQKENKNYDLIFIDGNHTYKATKEDFEFSLPMLKKGGYIAFHNCSPGMTQEDKYYLKLDGGPWMLAHELGSNANFTLVSTNDRVKIFQKIN